MIKPDRIEDIGDIRVIGLNRTYTIESRGDIPGQWADWRYDQVCGVTADAVYGVSHGFRQSGQFDYMCALPVDRDAPVPEDQSDLILPAGPYAIYVHQGHVSGIAKLFDAVLCGNGPGDGLIFTPTPQFELYGDDFDPIKAVGKVELWFPVARLS